MIRNNHYIPEMYLKQFARKPDGRLFVYRTLVSHEGIKLWKPGSPGGTGYHIDLYTRQILGTETDELERWFCSAFEDPAGPVLLRVAGDEELQSDDWTVLVRLLASLIVRTPAFFVNMLPVWNRVIRHAIEHASADVETKLEWSRVTGEPLPPPDPPPSGFPIKINRQDVPEEGIAKLTTTVLVGRALWLYEIRRMLTQTINVLHKHSWSVFHAPFGKTFFTSDDPVVLLNYVSASQFNFRAGWNAPGTEIFVPLTPKHLFYTKIGQICPSRGLILTVSEMERFRTMIAKHAHRFIYAPDVDGEISIIRPREVNEGKFRAETAQWRTWHREQLEAENQLGA